MLGVPAEKGIEGMRDSGIEGGHRIPMLKPTGNDRAPSGRRHWREGQLADAYALGIARALGCAHFLTCGRCFSGRGPGFPMQTDPRPMEELLADKSSVSVNDVMLNHSNCVAKGLG